MLTGALASPALADDATALLQSHRAFVGWTLGDGTFTSLRMEGTLGEPDAKPQNTADFQDIFSGLTERRTLVTSRGLDYDVGFNGTTFWRSSSNGFIGRVVGDPAKYEVSRQLLFIEATTQLQGTVMGRKDIGGTSYPIVRVQFADKSFPIDLYINEATGAYRRAVVDPGGTFETTFDIIGYADALPGKRVIAKWREDGSKAVYTLTKIRANEKLNPQALAPPPPTAHWAFANDKPFPIHVTEQGIFVTAKVNGVEGSFTLDTGSGSIVLSDEFARRVHLTEVQSSTSYGIGGAAKADIQKAETFEIGGNTLSKLELRTGLHPAGDQEGEDGLLGYDFLAGAIVELDLDNQQMTIYDPAQMSPSRDSGIAVIVDLSDGLPLVPMKLNSRIDVNAVFDTGNPDYVLFSSDLASKYGLKFFSDPNGPQSSLMFAGVGENYANAECGNLDEIRLGSITYASPKACKLTGDISDRFVLVGFDFLKHFNFVFDYPDALIVLQPRK